MPAGQPKFRHDLEFVRSLMLPVRLIDAQSGELLANTQRDPVLSSLSVAATFARPVRIDGVRGEGLTVSAVFLRSRARLTVFPHLYFEQGNPDRLLNELSHLLHRPVHHWDKN